ncbi:MAG: carboxypeptidase-like regulatory domain-containing protein [Cyclobacteriaceae bacterium]
MKRINTIFLLLLAISPSLAQTLVGVVLDSASLEPVPFAHVRLGHSVTVTNPEGEYVINQETRADSILEISFIGYRTWRKNINISKTHRALLVSSVTNLESVTVLTGDILMDRVFRSTITNYDQERKQMTSYYKEKLSRRDSMYYLAEGIMNIYRPGWLSSEEVQIEPLRTRKRVDISYNQEDVIPINGHAYDMIVPSIWREGSFLDVKNRKHYEFTYEGRMSYRDRAVYMVSFSPANNKGYISGKLYIEDETFAIVRMEYEPDPGSSKFWKWAKWVEEYEPMYGLYYLTLVSFEGSFLDYNKTYDYSALLVNNDISSPEGVPVLDSVIGKKDIFFDQASFDFTDSFWKGFNYIKLTAEEQGM